MRIFVLQGTERGLAYLTDTRGSGDEGIQATGSRRPFRCVEDGLTCHIWLLLQGESHHGLHQHKTSQHTFTNTTTDDPLLGQFTRDDLIPGHSHLLQHKKISSKSGQHALAFAIDPPPFSPPTPSAQYWGLARYWILRDRSTDDLSPLNNSLSSIQSRTGRGRTP